MGLCYYCPFLIQWQISPFSLTPCSACMCQCRRLRRLSQELLWEPEKRILPYTLKVLPVRASHTGSVCDACLHLNVHLDKPSLGLSWAKHCRINQHQTCTQSCTAVLPLASTHRENTRDILQLTGMQELSLRSNLH